MNLIDLHRMIDTAQALRAVRFDEYDRPDRALPDCPRCEENELIGTRNGDWRCLLCSWTCAFTPEMDA